MLEELARSQTESLARVGRRLVRLPFYALETWLAEHPDLTRADYCDWLLLLDWLEHRIREESLEVVEVPFSPSHYASWLAQERVPDSNEARSKYLGGLSVDDLRELQARSPLRPQAPVLEATTAACYLLPTFVEWDGPPAMVRRYCGQVAESALRNVARVVARSLDIEEGIHPLSRVRCMGADILIYPRLVGASDFDSDFGARYGEWLRKLATGLCEEGGVTDLHGLPRSRNLGSSGESCAGICVGVVGAAAQVDRFGSIDLNPVDCLELSQMLCAGMGVPPGTLRAGTSFCESGGAEAHCMEFLGIIGASDAADEWASDPKVEAARAASRDARLLSLMRDASEIGSELGSTARMGVVIPFGRANAPRAVRGKEPEPRK